MSEPKVTSWSPSRYEKYTSCPRRFLLETIKRMCALCFKGTMGGKWGEAQTCDKCGGREEVPAPIERGNVLHKLAEQYITGATETLHNDLKNVKGILAALRRDYKKGTVRVEHDLVFAQGWVPVPKFTKGAWLRTKADVIQAIKSAAVITDWKSGGVDKRTGLVRAEAKYDDQLEVYALVTMVAMPTVESVTSRLAFIDAPKSNLIERNGFYRRDLPKLKAKWEKKIAPMFADDVYAPCPSDRCRWCPYKKGNGGPCPF